MKQLLAIISLLVCGITLCHAQDDNKTVVGVAQFSCQQESPYTHLVTEKVVEMLTNAKRFKVVDRTSRDKIQEELELQKSEAFMDSKNLVEQDVAVSAEKLITGEIVKIPVYRMKNADGSVRGYKASVAFQMKVVDVATGLSTDATSFTGQASKECLSPESAVTMAKDEKSKMPKDCPPRCRPSADCCDAGTGRSVPRNGSLWVIRKETITPPMHKRMHANMG